MKESKQSVANLMWEYSDEDKELDKYEGIPAQ